MPRKTRLIKIGKSEKNELTGEEKDVLWFVPEEFYDRYLEDCEKYPDRQVELTTKDKPLPSWSLDGYNLSKEQVDRIRGVPENQLAKTENGRTSTIDSNILRKNENSQNRDL